MIDWEKFFLETSVEIPYASMYVQTGFWAD